MRRIGRDKVQLAGVTVAGMFGFLLLLPLLVAQDPTLPRGWSPPPGLSGPGPGPAAPTALATLSAHPLAAARPAAEEQRAARSSEPAEELDAAAPDRQASPGTRARREATEERTDRPGVLTGWVEDPAGRRVPGGRVRYRALQRQDHPEGSLLTDAAGEFRIELRAGNWAVWAEGEGFAPTSPLRVRVRAGQTRALDEPLRLAAAGLLVGLVQDALGRPLVGAQVSVRADRQRLSAETDAQGRFGLQVAEGLYTVSASAPGYVAAGERQVPVALSTGGEVELTLEPGGALEGLVLDADGRPLPDAFVFVYRDGQRLGQAPSDAQGRFRVSELDPGPVELFARSRDRARCARLPAEARPGQVQLVTLRLAPGAQVTGTVSTARGEPLPEVEVQARSVQGDVRRSGKTDDQGQFTVADLYPGRYRVTIPGLTRDAPRAEAELEVGAGAARCDLVTRDGGVLAGVVTGPDGQPVARAGVFAIQEGVQRAETRSDEQGAWRIEDLPAGTYQVFSRRDRELAGTLPPLTLPSGGAHTDLRVTVYPPARLRGRVLDASGQPVEGLELLARGRDAPVLRRTRTDAEGRFQMAPFYAGGYRLAAEGSSLTLEARRRGAAQAHVTAREFEVVAGRDVDLELRLVTSDLTGSGPAPPR